VKVVHFSHGPTETDLETGIARATINAYHKLSNLYIFRDVFWQNPHGPSKSFQFLNWRYGKL